jgi:arylsulfatase A-like enzyme
VRWRWAIAPAVLAGFACAPGPKPVDLTAALGDLKEASANGRNLEWVKRQSGKPLRMNDVVQKVLLAWPPSRLRFEVRVPKAAHLSFSYSLLPEGTAPGGVDFLVLLGSETVWSGHLDAASRSGQKRWYAADVDLTRFSGRSLDLVFETRLPTPSPNPPRAYWGNPALTSRAAAPLVIVYLVDTLRADHTGPYGYARDTTPRLNAFAKDAVVFETAVSQASWTKPSVASLMTSLLPGQHRAVQLRDTLDPKLETLALRMSKKGFSTGAAIANSVIYSEGTNFDIGFDFFAGLHGPHNRPSKLVEAAGVVDAALSFIDSRRGFPSFLYVHTMDPHVPYSPPPPFDRKFEPYATPDHPATDPRSDFKEPLDRDRMIARYDGDVAYGDQEFGRFIDGLKARGLYDQAFIVFMADHGEEFQDHGQWLHGRSVFDELIHIPLIVKFPAMKDAGRRVKPQVQEVDVLPTILESQGFPVPKPPEILGHPLQEVLAGGSHETLAISEISHRGYVARGIRSIEEKYIERFSPEEGELYFDLLQDPKELVNKLEEKPQRVRVLRDDLEKVMTSNPFQNHLRLVGPGDFSLRLRTSGWLQQFEQGALGPGDKAELDPNGRKVHLSVHGAGSPGREVSFSVRPVGAPVYLEGTLNGRPLEPTQIFMGEDGVNPGEMPARLPEVEGSEAEAHATNNVLAPPRKQRPGIDLWLTTSAQILFPGGGNCEALKGLGYVDHCPGEDGH